MSSRVKIRRLSSPEMEKLQTQWIADGVGGLLSKNNGSAMVAADSPVLTTYREHYMTAWHHATEDRRFLRLMI